MDTSRLERFARYARRYLIEQTEKKLIQILTYTDGIESEQRRAYPQQVKALETEILDRYGITIEKGATAIDTKKMADLIDMVAYTWFNRFCALRYMDMNQYNKIGVVSPLPGHFQPEILEEAKAGYIDESMVSERDRKRVFDLISGAETHPDPQHEAYRVLVRAVSNYYAHIMPFLFDPIAKWKELLMPEDLLSGESILSYTREAMTPRACRSVEVIGWLYQYYISEKKSDVQAAIKRRVKVQSRDIPAVTQLFTPEWIVKYMVENSLGRLWMKNNPNSNLKDRMEYYIEDGEENAAIDQNFCKIDSPEEIRFCDPCCGSGHTLSYAFDLLYRIYDEEGYDHNSISALIIENNLYGIEIDGRASELSAFALSMKAREKDPLWFNKKIEPNICRLENISFGKDEIEPYLDKCGRDIFTLNFERMLSQFEHADTYGSLIVPAEQDIEGIRELLNAKDFSGDVFLAPTHKKVLKLIDQADYLSTKYQVVVTNPPYMGKGMSDQLSKYLSDNFNEAKSDLFSAFILRNLNLCQPGGQLGFMTPFVWMFISSYEKLRKYLIKNTCITSLVQLEYSGFDGATVPICTFTLENSINPKHKGGYIKLSEFRGSENQAPRTLEAIANPDCGWFFRCATSDFAKIPGAPIAYWVSDKVRDIFISSKPLADVASAKVGLQTGDNDRFLRYWFETELHGIGFGMSSRQEAKKSGKKWFPYNKGGEFRKWYGNQEFVVNWENDGEAIRNFTFDNGKQRSVVRNPDYYFRESITWSALSSAKISLRYSPAGFLFDTKGQCLFADDAESLYKYMAMLNTSTTSSFLKFLSPTLDFNSGVVAKVPVRIPNALDSRDIEHMLLSGKQDWDSSEISWDFQQLPLLQVFGARCQVLVKEAYEKLREQWIEDTLKMQELEEENNRIFIEAYGLQDELSPDVPLKEITLTCNPYYRYGVNPEVLGVRALGVREFPLNAELEKRLLADTMKELISYSVGCMFGRYSLNEPGLIVASQGEAAAELPLGVRSQGLGVRGDEVAEEGVRGDSGEADLKPKTYHLKPNQEPKPYLALNNVIPILDEEWFADDMVNRFSDFLKEAFGEDNFEENLRFIEDAIGKDIRRYFIRDFYNDHLKMYRRRPIYWLFSSPKGSFNALIYMHRYSPDTASIILNDYLREYVFKLNNRLADLRDIEISADSSQREKTQASKEIDKIESIITELEYWEKDYMYPLAAKRVEIDLDDGVKANYALFDGVLKGVRL